MSTWMTLQVSGHLFDESCIALKGEVFCSDSSKKGYALHVSRVDRVDLAGVAAIRERWRFVPTEKLPHTSSAA
eukprot:4972094-Karenia_brevis.AAC.1